MDRTDTSTPAPPEAVIVIPTLNEAAHIGPVLAGLTADADDLPIWVMDGGSIDATRKIVRGLARQHPRITLQDNPSRTQAAALNLAARQARSLGARALVRMDAHARYPAGFARRAVQTLHARNADSIVVPLIATGNAGWQAAVAALQRSWLGHGGAAHRRASGGGWTDHGHHAAFRLDTFDAVGGYNPRLAANEDVDFDIRLHASGGRIWLDPDLAVTYLPRATPLGLWRQMHRNGWWRVETAILHRRPLGLRQMLPVLATVIVATSGPAAVLLYPAAIMPALGYLLLCTALGLAAGGWRRGPAVIILAMVAHLGFGTGALARLFRLPHAHARRVERTATL